MNPMDGLEFTMLAAGDSGGMILLVLFFFFGPIILTSLGLILSFFRRCRGVAIAAIVIGCSIWPLFALMGGGDILWREGFLETLFLEWDIEAWFIKLPFLLGMIAVPRVYYLRRKEKQQRRRRAAMKGYEERIGKV